MKVKYNKETNRLEITKEVKKVTFILFDKKLKSVTEQTEIFTKENCTEKIAEFKEIFKNDGFKVVDVAKESKFVLKEYDINDVLDNLVEIDESYI